MDEKKLLYLILFIEMESYSICHFLTGLFHIACNIQWFFSLDEVK